MAETGFHANTNQGDYRIIPTVPEDIASPDESRTYPDGLLKTSTAHNRAQYPHQSFPTDAAEAIPANKIMSNHQNVADGSTPPAERRSSTATTATMMSGAASLAGKSVECPGCKKLIDQASGGVVVAFGKSLWHVDCFRCVKCHNRVTADTNLLLLSDGDPVCGNCSYQCYVCKLPITEEAIMTGDESYHAHCFTCRACSNKIEELVFAKTSQGIYCMSCHNERVARSRRHAEAKQRAKIKKDEREKAQSHVDAQAANAKPPSSAASPSAVPKDNSADMVSAFGAYSLSSPNARSPNAVPSRSQSPASRFPSSSPHISSPVLTEPLLQPRNDKPISLTPVPDARERAAARSEERRKREEFAIINSSPDPSPSPGSRAVFDDGRLDRLSPRLVSDSGSPSLAGSAEETRGKPATPRSPAFSADPSMAGNAAIGLGVGPVAGLTLPTGRAEKRRSINPAMALNYQDHQTKADSVPSPSHQSMDSYSVSRGSTLPPSPLRTSSSDDKTHSAPTNSGGNSNVNPASSPIPNRLYSSGVKEPSRSDLSIIAQDEAMKSRKPPRSSSLADAMNATTAFPSNSREAVRRESSRTFSPALSRDTASSNSTMTVVTQDLAAPRTVPITGAPELPSLNFSASKSDFAMILEETNHVAVHTGTDTPKRPAMPAYGVNSLQRGQSSGSRIQPLNLSLKDGSSRSLPNSPAYPANNNAKASANPNDTVSAWITETPYSEISDPFYSPDPTKKLPAGSQESTSSAADRDDSWQSLHESVLTPLQAVLADKQQHLNNVIQIDIALLDKAVKEIIDLTNKVRIFSQKYSGAKRTSQHYMEGLGVAHEEYAKEVGLRLEAEAEIARLRAERHDQHARLSLIVNEERRQEDLKRRSNDLALNLSGLEKDVSKLKVERDMALAEVEELVCTKDDVSRSADPVEQGATLTRSITSKLNNLKEKYRRELEPLTAEKQVLKREISDLRDTRNLYLEESVALSSKNEELAEHNTRLAKQTEAMQDMLNRHHRPPHLRGGRQHISGSPSMSSLTTSATLHEHPDDMLKGIKALKIEPLETAPAARRFKNKWYKSSKGPEIQHITSVSISKPLNTLSEKSKPRSSHDPAIREHVFQPHSILRFCKCEHCGDKMWGLQEQRCAICGIYCHAKCIEKLAVPCNASNPIREEPLGDAPPSMFGRPLNEQIIADGQSIPVIVSKCIEAVEAQAMDHEGVYRKTGGSSLSKLITQLFERGQYDAFNLQDSDRFNDINSITSVLKNYFRQLPDPLLTYQLHESFVAAASIKEVDAKSEALTGLIRQLPKEHYTVLGYLMLHLHRVKNNSGENLMNARNLGVVFGPTLMRSSDPAREFADMAGKALSIEWMVDNAPNVFQDPQDISEH